VIPVASAKAYNSLWQFKADAWSALEDAAMELNVAISGEGSPERAADTATELLDVLAPIERLYAYPGTQRFSEVRRMFAAGKYDQFADMVGVGATFGPHQNYQAGFRFQHLSNAGIEHPNPGINFSEIYVQYNF